jgi:palmitoyl transferase
MRRTIASLALSAGALCATTAHAFECADLWDWLDKGCRRVVDTYENGGNELLVSGYSYHVPATWTAERRAELNAEAWGGGWGRTTEDPNGDQHTVFFLGFLDSHKNAQLQIGYAWNRYWGPREGLQVGLGWTGMIVQRPDIAEGIPFPVLLPLLSFKYQKAQMVMTYIPNVGGGINNGSTLYVFGRIGLY